MRKKFRVTPTLRKKINALAKKAKCPLNWKRSSGLQWNGEDTACKNEDASNIIHDIAHFVLASVKERKHYDFGLGASPSSAPSASDAKGLKPLYNFSICQEKEKRASALGIYWEKKFGLPWEDTMKFHSWYLEDLEKEWKSLRYYITKFNKQ